MRKAILVDDEIFARKGLIELIPWERHGFEVVAEAEDGEDALVLIERLRPDVVFTDIRMPVLDGFQLIQQVRESGNNKTKFIIISGHGDFKYTQQAVRFGIEDYLLKPIDENELIETLDRIAASLDDESSWNETGNRLLQTSMFERLLSGQEDERFLDETARMLGVPKDRPMRYVAAEINDMPSSLSLDRRMEQIERIRQTIVEIAAGRAGQNDGFAYVRGSAEIGFLIYGETATPYVQWLCAELVAAIARQAVGTMRMYAGSIVSGLSRLRESFFSVSEAKEYKFVQPEADVLIYEDVKEIGLTYKEMDSALYAELMESVEERDEKAIKALTDRLFAFFAEQRLSPESIQASISRCLHGATRIIQTMDGDENEIGCFLSLMHWHHEPRTPQGLKELFFGFLAECSDYVSELRSTRTKGDIGKIKHYIESHYSENISLKSIAKKFYMNPVYLGQLFKKAYGVYFNEFLLRIRINEAKKQLRQTDYKVYEIAANVGFGNADYFVSQFEKVEGKTPTEYKNEIQARA